MEILKSVPYRVNPIFDLHNNRNCLWSGTEADLVICQLDWGKGIRLVGKPDTTGTVKAILTAGEDQLRQ